VLAHHAEGAGDVAAIRRYALEAARWSAALGAHREAVAQYQRALRYADAADKLGLAGLQEGLAAECSLLDRLDEAEAALRAALQHRRVLGDNLHVGEDLSTLSDILWQQCRGDESALAVEESLRVLQPLPPGPELAMAQIGVAASMFTAGRQAEAFEGISQALELPAADPRHHSRSPRRTGRRWAARQGSSPGRGDRLTEMARASPGGAGGTAVGLGPA
jgi:tetratricopeptide (TPR) repeat protein